LLGAKECTWGPGYWCKNLTNAKSCNAVKHCIQTVWEKQTVPEDNDSVCQICLDMVKQARDQLESNETQDDLRAVFEGSCQLIYVKPIVKECIKMVDNFIPELIEALASQMNPQVVCSVAGLCNNAHIDELLAQHAPVEGKEGKEFTCGKCSRISSQITTKFRGTSRDTVLENMLEMCGQMSSFSDACSSILLTYFNEIYAQLSDNLTPDALCHLTGACAGKFHQHPELVEIRPKSDVGYVDVKDDIPCELCEQLVNHLRDLLTANTTESEFKQVLEGLCGQTKGFKDECLSIVGQYYAEIYEFLTKNLDSNEACFYIGVCPKGDDTKGPIAPLVSSDIELPSQIKKKLLGEDEPTFTSDEIMSFQLPLERLMARPQQQIDHEMGAPNSGELVRSGTWCTMCEYALHFVQEEIADPKNEEEIKNSVLSTCSRMPNYLRAECDNFVELYGDALIALLVQEADPSQICPRIRLCPDTTPDSEVFAPSTIDVQVHSESMNKGSCPLCLLAVEQAEQVIQQDKTEQKVKDTLKNLCSHLKNKKLNLECQDFVDTYSKELLEMLMKDFTPQEICVYLKLCTDSAPRPSDFGVQMVVKNDRNQEIETNEIADNTIDGIMFTMGDREVVAKTPECLLCNDIVKEIEKRVVHKSSKEEIKNALEHACDKVPKKASQICHGYIDKYGDRISELIEAELSPKEICRDIELCFDVAEDNNDDDLEVDDAIQVTVFTSAAGKNEGVGSQTCVLCEMIISRMEKEIENPKNQDEVKAYLEKVCIILPKRYRNECDKFIEQYSDLIVETIDHIPAKEVCTEIQLCTNFKSKANDEIVECAVCEGSVAALESLLKNKQVDEDIEQVLEESCHEVPARYYQRCMNMVNVYGISMIEQLKEYPESHNVCAEIGMCYRDQKTGFVQMKEVNEPKVIKKTQTLVGDNECTWGPSHFCGNEEIAKKCGATDYCKRKAVGKWAV